MNIEWLALGACLIAIALFVRVFFYPVATSDYTGFLAHWIEALSRQGMGAFRAPFADYAPLYLYLLRLLALVPAPPLYAVKTLSVAFDALIGYFFYRIMRSVFWAKPAIAFLAAAVAFSIPTVVANGALWGQSDALYAACALASLLFILRRRLLLACIAFGIALSFKVQAIFFLPVLAGALLARPRTLVYALAIPAVFLATLVPALLAGASLSYWGLIYLHQSGEYPWLTLSAPSVFAFLEKTGLDPTFLFYAGLAAAGMAAVALTLMARGAYRKSPARVVAVAVLSALLIPYLLPRMHERYFFLADVLSTLYAFVAPRRWYLPVLVVGASLLSYVPYLAGQVPALAGLSVDLRIPAAMMTLALLLALAANVRKSGSRAGAASGAGTLPA